MYLLTYIVLYLFFILCTILPHSLIKLWGIVFGHGVRLGSKIDSQGGDRNILSDRVLIIDSDIALVHRLATAWL